MADEVDSGKKLSLREKKRAAGRLGGLATARKSEEFLAARGAKGGLITRMIHGSAFYAHISRLRWARRDDGGKA